MRAIPLVPSTATRLNKRLHCFFRKNGYDAPLAGLCPLCRRWQRPSEPSFAAFPGGRFKHLACVECHLGAWCRDFWSRPTAVRCAAEAYVEAFDRHTVMGEFK